MHVLVLQAIFIHWLISIMWYCQSAVMVLNCTEYVDSLGSRLRQPKLVGSSSYRGQDKAAPCIRSVVLQGLKAFKSRPWVQAFRVIWSLPERHLISALWESFRLLPIPTPSQPSGFACPMGWVNWLTCNFRWKNSGLQQNRNSSFHSPFFHMSLDASVLDMLHIYWESDRFKKKSSTV